MMSIGKAGAKFEAGDRVLWDDNGHLRECTVDASIGEECCIRENCEIDKYYYVRTADITRL